LIKIGKRKEKQDTPYYICGSLFREHIFLAREIRISIYKPKVSKVAATMGTRKESNRKRGNERKEERERITAVYGG